MNGNNNGGDNKLITYIILGLIGWYLFSGSVKDMMTTSAVNNNTGVIKAQGQTLDQIAGGQTTIQTGLGTLGNMIQEVSDNQVKEAGLLDGISNMVTNLASDMTDVKGSLKQQDTRISNLERQVSKDNGLVSVAVQPVIQPTKTPLRVDGYPTPAPLAADVKP